jgi:hypothetical protein
MGWQDAPLVEVKAPNWQAAPLVEDKKGGFLQQVGNTVGGLVRGAGSIGATILDSARGLGAAATNATPVQMRPDVTTGLQELPRGDEMRSGMDAGLQELGADPGSLAYKGGKLTAEVAGTLGVGGAMAKTAQAAGAAAPVVEALASGGLKAGGVTGIRGAALRAGAGAATGGATGALIDPKHSGGAAVAGAVTPGALQALGKVGSVAGQGYRAAKAAVEPFTEAGRGAIASRVLANAAGDEAPAVISRLEQAAELVPGSAPTAAQVAENGGVAALERAVAAQNPAPFTERAMEQAAARTQALRDIAGTDATRQAAVDAREAATGDLYRQATGATYTMDERFQRLLQAPAMQQALARAKALAENNERAFTFEVSPPDTFLGLGNSRVAASKQITGQGLMDLKMAMDDMLRDPASGYAGAAGNALRSLRGKLVNWMEDSNPAFKEARTLYAEKSKPIGQMDIGTKLLEKLEPALSDYGALGRETAGRYTQALRNADQTARTATGFKGASMAETMTPDQMAALEAIGFDLGRKANAQDLGRGVGSDTYQKLIRGNIADQAGHSRAMDILFDLPLLRKIPQAIYEAPEQKIRDDVARALLQPKSAAQMMKDEIARKAVKAQTSQPLLSPEARAALELLFVRSSPAAVSGQ